MKTLTIKCDGINSISTQYYSGEIEIELENPDYQFIQDLEADLLLRNGLDWETFVKEIDKQKPPNQVHFSKVNQLLNLV